MAEFAARRPPWLARKPDVELDCRADDAPGEPLYASVMEAADRLPADHIISVRIDVELAPLSRLLNRKGCEQWHAPLSRGVRMVYFRKTRRV